MPDLRAQGLRQGVGIAVFSSGVGSKPSLRFLAIVPRVLPAPEWLGDLMLIPLNLIPLMPPQGAVWREAGLDCRLWGTPAMSHQKALLLISLVRRVTHRTRVGGRLSQSPFPAQEQEDEPKGGAGDQAHGLGSAFHTGFCRTLGFWGGTSGGPQAKGLPSGLSVEEEPQTRQLQPEQPGFQPHLELLPPTTLSKQNSAQNKSWRIT